MANNNAGGAMNFTTDQIDALFNQSTSAFDKGMKMVGHIAQSVNDVFGNDSRRNVGGYPYMGAGYGYGATQQQPQVQYGYGYASSNPYGSFGMMDVPSMNNGMFSDNMCDGFYNPAYGKAGY